MKETKITYIHQTFFAHLKDCFVAPIFTHEGVSLFELLVGDYEVELRHSEDLKDTIIGTQT